jgi:hypothetical protein
VWQARRRMQQRLLLPLSDKVFRSLLEFKD